MNTISMSEFKKLNTQEIRKIVPLTIAVDGEPRFVIDDKDSVIALGDLHIVIRRNLKALEMRARKGMSPPKKLTFEDIRKQYWS